MDLLADLVHGDEIWVSVRLRGSNARIWYRAYFMGVIKQTNMVRVRVRFQNEMHYINVTRSHVRCIRLLPTNRKVKRDP